jgi:DNA-binding GntR family transcriptional regulator
VAPAVPAPRRLLRDVVFDRLLAAVGDGTLEFGERLNDEELVTWLGVSRTPVREAIAKLEELGLVEIEANRWTRVVTPTAELFEDCTTTLTGLWSLAASRGVAEMSDADVAEIGRLAELRLTDGVAETPESIDAMFTLADVLMRSARSPSLLAAAEPVSRLTTVMFRRLAENSAYPWQLGTSTTTTVAEGVARRDAEGVAALLRRQATALAPFFAAVRETGFYPTRASS